MGQTRQPGSDEKARTIDLEKLLEHVGNAMEQQCRQTPHLITVDQIMVKFYKAWSTGMLDYAKAQGIELT